VSAVAEQFAARFDAALRVKPKDKAAQAPYDRLNEFVRKLAKLADVDACLDRYTAIYPRYAKDDPRSEMIFAMLVERRIRMTGPDDDFVDRLYEEVFTNRKPSAVAAHIRELEANRRNGILKVLKEARDQLQRRADLADPLRQMYRRAHDGRPATSVDELYTFDPFPDPKLQADYQRIVEGLNAGWRAAEKQFSSRSYAYSVATEVTEAVRLRTTGYAGFKLRFDAFQEYLAGKRSDERALFQLLKWSRDTVRPVKVVKGRQTSVGTTGNHLEFEVYIHIVFAVYLNAVQYRHLLRKPEGFTKAEEAFFLDPIRRATYRSNFINRFKLVFPDGGKPSNVENFTKLAELYAELILFARSQNLDLVNDDRALEIQRTIETTPWQELVSQRFSTIGMGGWAYAQDTFARGDRIGTDIRVAYFEGSRPRRVYLELDAAPGFLFEASLSSFTRKVEIGLYKLVWEQNKGLIVLIQKYFEIIGYEIVLVEAGFIGLVKQVVQDQLVGAGLADASEAFGIDLDWLPLVLQVLSLLRGHRLTSGRGGGLGNAELRAQRAVTSAELRTQRAMTSAELRAQRAVTSGEATANKALTTLAGDDATVLNRLTPGDTGLVNARDAALSKGEQLQAKAIANHVDRNEQRMVRVQQQAIDQQAQILQRTRAVGTARAEHVDIQTQAATGGALQTEAASRRVSGGATTGGPPTTGGTTRGATTGGGSTTGAGSTSAGPTAAGRPGGGSAKAGAAAQQADADVAALQSTPEFSKADAPHLSPQERQEMRNRRRDIVDQLRGGEIELPEATRKIKNLPNLVKDRFGEYASDSFVASNYKIKKILDVPRRGEGGPVIIDRVYEVTDLATGAEKMIYIEAKGSPTAPLGKTDFVEYIRRPGGGMAPVRVKGTVPQGSPRWFYQRVAEIYLKPGKANQALAQRLDAAAREGRMEGFVVKASETSGPVSRIKEIENFTDEYQKFPPLDDLDDD
jgi:hypothetical protein